jgi:hypothetical protein
MGYWEGAKDVMSIGTPVEEGFVNSSNTNPQWATHEELLSMIEDSLHA